MWLIITCALALIASSNGATLQKLEKAEFRSGRIIHGYDAQPGEAPFIVSIQYWGGHFCGGVIIDEHWVLTAAHCLHMYYSIKVIAGLYAQNDKSNVQTRELYDLKYQIKHEQFEGGVGPYDIGLIYVREPFDLQALARDGSPAVSKIALPSGKYAATGRGKLYGWGRTLGYELPNVLQALDVDIIDYEQCKADLPAGALIHETNICTFDGTNDGACDGDSGGPLVKVQPNGEKVLMGLVSWGYSPCGWAFRPTVYTWTLPFEQWINETIANFV